MKADLPDVNQLLEQCSAAGLRKTAALESCLSAFVEASRPITLQEIADSPQFSAQADPATIYRLVQRLEERRIVRRIGFHSRAAHYCLRSAEHQDFLICRGCGAVEVLDIACPVEHLEQTIAKESGFSDLEHELEFYGQCTSCQ